MTLENAMYEFFSGAQVMGPGSDQTTTRMLELVTENTQVVTAIDIGCGAGRSSIALAHQGIEVTAVDNYQPFLDGLDEKAKEAKLANKITTVNMSMDQLDFPDKSYDLVWSEASAYVLGFENALQSWKRLLKPSGCMVVTECCWTNDNPSKAASNFWADEYPGMLSVNEAQIVAGNLGFEVVEIFALPESDWQNYYIALNKRAIELEENAGSEIKQVIEHNRREKAIRDEYKADYDYIAFVLKLGN